MNVKEFIRYVAESKRLREAAMEVGKPELNRDFAQARRVSVEKDAPRLNDARKVSPKQATKPEMGTRKIVDPTAVVGEPGLNIDYMGRRDVKVEKVHEDEQSLRGASFIETSIPQRGVGPQARPQQVKRPVRPIQGADKFAHEAHGAPSIMPEIKRGRGEQEQYESTLVEFLGGLFGDKATQHRREPQAPSMGGGSLGQGPGGEVRTGRDAGWPKGTQSWSADSGPFSGKLDTNPTTQTIRFALSALRGDLGEDSPFRNFMLPRDATNEAISRLGLKQIAEIRGAKVFLSNKFGNTGRLVVFPDRSQAVLTVWNRNILEADAYDLRTALVEAFAPDAPKAKKNTPTYKTPNATVHMDVKPTAKVGKPGLSFDRPEWLDVDTAHVHEEADAEIDALVNAKLDEMGIDEEHKGFSKLKAAKKDGEEEDVHESDYKSARRYRCANCGAQYDAGDPKMDSGQCEACGTHDRFVPVVESSIPLPGAKSTAALNSWIKSGNQKKAPHSKEEINRPKPGKVKESQPVVQPPARPQPQQQVKKPVRPVSRNDRFAHEVSGAPSLMPEAMMRPQQPQPQPATRPAQPVSKPVRPVSRNDRFAHEVAGAPSLMPESSEPLAGAKSAEERNRWIKAGNQKKAPVSSEEIKKPSVGHVHENAPMGSIRRRWA